MSDLIDRQEAIKIITWADNWQDELNGIRALPRAEVIPLSVIDDIKSEIQALPKTYPFVNHMDTYVKDADVIKIIERHCGGDTE